MAAMPNIRKEKQRKGGYHHKIKAQSQPENATIHPSIHPARVKNDAPPASQNK
jgi:hypothetical protein